MKTGNIISIIIIVIVTALTTTLAVVHKTREKTIASIDVVIDYEKSEYGYDCVSEKLRQTVKDLEKDIVGKPFDDTTLYKTKGHLQALSYIKSCNCYPYAEDAFRIEITARKAFIKLQGKGLYADEGGVVMDLSSCNVPKDLEFVELQGNYPQSDEKWISKAVDLALKTLSLSKDATLKSINALSPNNIDLQIETSSPQMPALTVHFGNLDEQEAKLARLETFLTTVLPTATKKYKTVDVRYKKQIICK